MFAILRFRGLCADTDGFLWVECGFEECDGIGSVCAPRLLLGWWGGGAGNYESSSRGNGGALDV
jgi:hypothetical protein